MLVESTDYCFLEGAEVARVLWVMFIHGKCPHVCPTIWSYRVSIYGGPMHSRKALYPCQTEIGHYMSIVPSNIHTSSVHKPWAESATLCMNLHSHHKMADFRSDMFVNNFPGVTIFGLCLTLIDQIFNFMKMTHRGH